MANSSQLSKVPQSKKPRYFETLSGDVRARYLSKIALVGGKDPYEMWKEEWDRDQEKWPAVSYFDIVNYLVYTLSHYSMEEMKAYKGLDSFNYFVSGWVQDVANFSANGTTLMIAKVRHSQMMRETPNRPWVICKPCGKVLAAHCTCMTGLAESCSHVGALLFAIEAGVKIREAKTVTQEKAYWLLPSGGQIVEYKEVNNIDFTSARKKKKQLERCLQHLPGPNEPRLATKTKRQKHVPPPTESEMDTFFAELNNVGAKSVILSLIPKYADTFVPKPLSPDYPVL